MYHSDLCDSRGPVRNRYADENGVEMLVDGSYHRIEQTPVTPMKALMAVQEGPIETADISAFIFIIGGAFGVVAETKAIEAGIGRIIKKTSKRQELLIPIMICGGLRRRLLRYV